MPTIKHEDRLELLQDKKSEYEAKLYILNVLEHALQNMKGCATINKRLVKEVELIDDRLHVSFKQEKQYGGYNWNIRIWGQGLGYEDGIYLRSYKGICTAELLREDMARWDIGTSIDKIDRTIKNFPLYCRMVDNVNRIKADASKMSNDDYNADRAFPELLKDIYL